MVPVSIEISPNVSMWSDQADFSLVLNGKNASNSDFKFGTLSHMGNCASTLSVKAECTGTPGLEFGIVDQPSNTSEVPSDSCPFPTGGTQVRWGWAQSAWGTVYQLGNVPKPAIGTIVQRSVAYFASTPDRLPDPMNIEVTVTWTLAIAP